MNQLNQEAMRRLYRAVLALKTEDECEAFFSDACTIQETAAIAQRLEVARHLNAGKNYNEINRLTGASTATICRVSRCIRYGSGGYQTVLKRMEEDHEPG